MTIHFVFWRMCVVATYMMAFLGIGAIGALFMKFVAHEMDKLGNIKGTEFTFYKFAKGCVRFYSKSAQWLGSCIVVLYMIALLGLLVLFSAQHWRQIWGP